MRKTTPIEDRFFAKVEWGENRYNGTRCLLWTASLVDGYGKFATQSRPTKLVRAHRWLYERWVGPIPEGMQLDHLCHNNSCPGGTSCPHRACVNPSHLAPATPRNNTLRGSGPSAKNVTKTHCLRGHEYTEANTYIQIYKSGRGGRSCRICRRMLWNRWYYKDRTDA